MPKICDPPPYIGGGECTNALYDVYFTANKTIYFQEGTGRPPESQVLTCIRESVFGRITNIFIGVARDEYIDENGERREQTFAEPYITGQGGTTDYISAPFFTPEVILLSDSNPQPYTTPVDRIVYDSVNIDRVVEIQRFGQGCEGNPCRCTGGDEQISCSGADGGICCIKKSALDSLCSKLS